MLQVSFAENARGSMSIGAFGASMGELLRSAPLNDAGSKSDDAADESEPPERFPDGLSPLSISPP